MHVLGPSTLMVPYRLGQEWMVDTYATMELGRLIWHHNNQDIIRAHLSQVFTVDFVTFTLQLQHCLENYGHNNSWLVFCRE